MFGTNLLQTLVGGIAAVATSFLAGMWWGDHYGISAHKLASAQAQLDATNRVLSNLQTEDDAIHAREAAAEKARMEDFKKADVQKLPINKSTAEALNKLTNGG
jgi:hypothetical protein